MGDLTAKCDWHDSTLSIVLPEDPERIAVRPFDSRHAPARLYVPEADALQLQAENERLRELVRDMHACIEALCSMVENSPGCSMCLTNQDEEKPCAAADVYCRMRELGVEV